jgi:HSP20 family protein
MALIRFNDYVPVPFNHLVDELINDTLHKGEERTYRPNADISESEKEYTLHLTLPGMEKSDIELNIDNRMLVVNAERKLPEYQEGVKYHLRESRYGKFSRKFELPENILEEKISAKFENGILLVTIPKDKPRPVKRTISIG